MNTPLTPPETPSTPRGDELKPCPFCGGTELRHTADNINMTDRIVCNDCKANAVSWKWQNRTPTPTPERCHDE